MSNRRPRRPTKKTMLQPVQLLYDFFKNHSRVHIWLYENKNLRIEGIIRGFDEYMNLVLRNAEELDLKKRTRRQVGEIMLKGENIALVQDTYSGAASAASPAAVAAGATPGIVPPATRATTTGTTMTTTTTTTTGLPPPPPAAGGGRQ